MPEVKAQRTLVKSPPELWAELSDIEGLARHLGEFGEIRITRTDPETTVAWEGEHARGTVDIEACGWGTKVTLKAEPAEVEPAAVEAEPAPVAEQHEPTAIEEEPAAIEVDPEPAAIEAVPAAEPAAEQPKPAAIEEAEPENPAGPHPTPIARRATPDPIAFVDQPTVLSAAIVLEPEPDEKPKKVGFFARLFARWRAKPAVEGADLAAEEPAPWAAEPDAVVEEPQAVAAVRETVAQEPQAVVQEPQAVAHEPEAVADEPETAAQKHEMVAQKHEMVVEKTKSSSAEPRPEPEEQAEPDPTPNAQRTTPNEPPSPTLAVSEDKTLEVLTATLDSLGAAHHRPFSRG